MDALTLFFECEGLRVEMECMPTLWMRHSSEAQWRNDVGIERIMLDRLFGLVLSEREGGGLDTHYLPGIVGGIELGNCLEWRALLSEGSVWRGD
jgi:hypothetical protein